MSLALRRGGNTGAFAGAMGLDGGVSGYSYHTVPVALFAWLRHADSFRDAVESALACGGDTAVGAIVGALAGASLGSLNIPKEWRDNLWDWPRSCGLLDRVARRLAEQRLVDKPLGPIHYFWPALVPRNLLFLLIVLGHGFRRCLPP